MLHTAVGPCLSYEYLRQKIICSETALLTCLIKYSGHAPESFRWYLYVSDSPESYSSLRWTHSLKIPSTFISLSDLKWTPAFKEGHVMSVRIRREIGLFLKPQSEYPQSPKFLSNKLHLAKLHTKIIYSIECSNLQIPP